MLHLFHVHTEGERLKKLFRHPNRVVHCRRADHGARWLIGDAEQKYSAAFVGERDAIFAKGVEVELRLGFLELKVLMFGPRVAPKIDLFGSRTHLAVPCTISISRPSVSFSKARMSARISSSERSGCGL